MPLEKSGLGQQMPGTRRLRSDWCISASAYPPPIAFISAESGSVRENTWRSVRDDRSWPALLASPSPIEHEAIEMSRVPHRQSTTLPVRKRCSAARTASSPTSLPSPRPIAVSALSVRPGHVGRFDQ